MNTKFKKESKNLKQIWRKAVSIGTLSAMVLTGIPVVPVTNAYAQETSAVLSENKMVYDLQNPELHTQKTITDYWGDVYETTIIEILITEDGTYTITGSNEVDGKYADVHISVAEGVKADVILDNVTIQNDDSYSFDINEDSTSEEKEKEPLFPFMDVTGEVNLYLKGKNVIAMPEDEYMKENEPTVFKLNGQLTVQEDADTPNSSLEVNCDGYLIRGGSSEDYCDGSFTLESGTVAARDAGIRDLNEWTMLGGSLSCYEAELNDDGNYQFLDGDMDFDYIIGSNKVKVESAKISGDVDIDQWEDGNGYSVEKMTITDLPKGKKVSAINGYPASALKTTSAGKLDAYLRKANNIIEIEGISYLYKWNAAENKLEAQPDAALCEVQFFNESTRKLQYSVKVEKNTEFGKLFDDSQYTYTYIAENGADFKENTLITSDRVVSMMPSHREYNVTIDGVTESMSILPAGKIYQAANGTCYSGGSYVTQDMTLNSMDSFVDANGVEYVQIRTKDDLNQFIEFAAADDHINARLENDIDLEKTTLNRILKSYEGIFDGNGYSVQNIKGDEVTTGGICRTLKGTIRNLWMHNMKMDSDATSNNGAIGSICGINRGVIENCMITGGCIYIKPRRDTDSEYDPIGDTAGVNLGVIRNCFERDNSLVGEGNVDYFGLTYTFAKNYATITNCYCTSFENLETHVEKGPVFTSIFGRTIKTLKSGEVCYFLNNKVSDGTQVWYQDLSQEGDNFPTLKKREGATVYAGFELCKSIYTNTQGTKPEHNFLYTAEKDSILAVCQNDSSHQAKAVLAVKDAEYDKKEHEAVAEYDESWLEYEAEKGEITYLREGKVTDDLISAGTIMAVLKIGDVQVTKEYTISEPKLPTATPTPTVTPVATPTATPVATPTATPVATPDTVVVTISKKTGPVPILPELIRPVVSKNTSQKLTWSKVKGADGYLVYAAHCSKGNDYSKLKLVCTITSAGKTSYTSKKLRKNDWYKYEVQAYRIVDGKKVVFGRSLQLHAATNGSKKYANPVAVRIVGSKKRTLKVGKISKIKARVILPKKKKCQWHIAKIQYCVSNPKVVSVANNGKIITKKPGQAIVYVVTQNGVMAKIKVKVRK